MTNSMISDVPVVDYSSLIDEPTRHFIERAVAAFPQDAVALDIARQRQLYNAMCKQFHAGYPDNITVNDSAVTHSESVNVPIRCYTPDVSVASAKPVQLVYLHGGGFVVGGLESHDDVCAEIAQRTGLVLTSVDYRLSPEHTYPAALDDTLCVLKHLWQEHQQPFVVCGDSAGATLAAAACHAYRNRRNAQQTNIPTISGMVLIYPGLGGDMEKGSYITHSNAPMLTTEDVRYYTTINSTHERDFNDPLFAPLRDSDFSGLPPAIIFSAQCDPLSDDGREYCEKIQRDNGLAHWTNEQGLVHGYLRGRHSVKRATDSFDRIVNAVSTLAEARWPF